MRKLISLALSALCAVSLLAGTAAAEKPAQPLRIWGAAGSITLGEDGTGTVLAVDGRNPGQADVLLKINGDTLLVDDQTGQASSLDQLREGDALYAWYGPAATRSLPPQSNAAVLVFNIPMDVGAGQYAVVQSVEQREDGLYITDAISGINCLLAADAELLSYYGQNKDGTPAIEQGTRLILWYDMEEGQYVSRRASLLPQADGAEEQEADKDQGGGKPQRGVRKIPLN